MRMYPGPTCDICPAPSMVAVNDSFWMCGGMLSSVTRKDSVSPAWAPSCWIASSGRLGLVEEDEVTVVGEPLIAVEAEATDVEGQPGCGDLHADVQVPPRRQIADLGLLAALEFPGHT